MEKPDFENEEIGGWVDLYAMLHSLHDRNTQPQVVCDAIVQRFEHVWNTLQEQLNLEKESNILLHKAMTTAESRGVQKGREEVESENKLLREENKHLIRKYVNHEEINAQLEQSKNLAIGLADNAVNDLKGEKACAEYWSKIGIEVKNIIDSNYSDKRKLSLINGVFEKYS